MRGAFARSAELVGGDAAARRHGHAGPGRRRGAQPTPPVAAARGHRWLGPAPLSAAGGHRHRASRWAGPRWSRWRRSWLGVLALTVLVNAGAGPGRRSRSKPLLPKFSHVDPIAGLKRLFGIEAVFNLLKALLKLAIIGVHRVAGAAAGLAADPRRLPVPPVPAILGVTRALAVRMAMLVGLVFLAIAAPRLRLPVSGSSRRTCG